MLAEEATVMAAELCQRNIVCQSLTLSRGNPLSLVQIVGEMYCIL